MSTYITTYPTAGSGPRVAVKDLIDMAGELTTAGSRAVAAQARPAERDAACLAGMRAARARVVGRTNLNELALGVTGINPWYGTPTNPLDPRLAPGGSSSGSAVAVAVGDAEVGLGTDTGGSVRIPAACCGVAGLKTTWGRVPLDGVRPLAPSLDTVGPLGRDVAALVTGMRLLEPGFTPAESPTGVRVGRVRLEAEPAVDAALDRLLATLGWPVVGLDPAPWLAATSAASTLLVAEAYRANRALLEEHGDSLAPDVASRLRAGRAVEPAALAAAEAARAHWRGELTALFERFDLLVTPTLRTLPLPLERADELLAVRCTLPVSLAGVPAVAVPAPTGGALPASLQLVGPWGTEEALLAAAAAVEAAARAG